MAMPIYTYEKNNDLTYKFHVIEELISNININYLGTSLLL